VDAAAKLILFRKKSCEMSDPNEIIGSDYETIISAGWPGIQLDFELAYKMKPAPTGTMLVISGFFVSTCMAVERKHGRPA
jgi:hypothetical protein